MNNSRRIWGTRQDHTILKDYERREPIARFTIRELEVWRDRIFDAIHQGYFLDRQGNRIILTDDVDILSGQKRGIDMLGDSIEADGELSPNFPFYGDLHNFGHVLFAFAHDPDGSHREEMGVMGDTTTAMRDPIFYRWHRFIDEIFQTYKLMQTPYRDDELSFPSVFVESLGVTTGQQANILQTFYDNKMVEASRGLDFGATTAVFVNLTRLNHMAFTYHIRVSNNSTFHRMVTVRLFLAPRLNESGNFMPYMEQKNLWAEMDKFTYTLSPGSNHIRQESTSSSVTIPEELTFRALEQGDAARESPEAYCGCSWPHHLLLPKGKVGGMSFELLVVITDWELDKANGGGTGGASRCTNASSFCGVLDEKYPDRRPMGFPLDRRVGPDVIRLPTREVFARFGNMKVQDVIINFTNRNLV